MTAAGSDPTRFRAMCEIGVDVAVVTMLMHKPAPDLHAP